MGELYQEDKLVNIQLNFYHEASKLDTFKNNWEDYFTSEEKIN